ncbi:restriction endonuclease subunit S, partial [Propionimicrobium lymphophilum]|uniref:restriction endonuclease subunit S n=1 Tax=Propionimicrobium lymphophilum TaxID=33012 RepID=UPI003EC556C1
MSDYECDNWISAQLGRFFRFRSGDSLPTSELARSGGYPVFGGNGQRGYTEKSNLNGANLLVGRQGALAGNVHRTTGPIFATEHALITTINPRVDINYAYYLLLQMNLNQYAQDVAAQPGLAASKIRKVKVAIPSNKDTQRQISTFLDSKTKEIDDLTEKLRRQVELLERYRRELIAHTVTRGLDPDAPMRDS